MKQVFTLLMVCASIWSAQSQCEPSEFCEMSSVLCGALIDGYEGTSVPPSFPPAPIPGFCGTIDNPQWIGFVPCEPNVSIDVMVENCIFFPPEGGMQVAIVDAEDCNSPFFINCVEQIQTGSVGQVNVSGLVPGQVYYLLLDGYSGDICEFQIFINQGINTVDPEYVQTEPGYIDGPSSYNCGGSGEYTAVLPICEAQNTTACTTPAPFEDCLYFEWTIPIGASIIGDENAQTVEINFPPGVSGLVSVEVVWDEDSCGDPACFCDWCLGEPIPPLFVSSGPIVTTTLPAIEVCEGEDFEFCGETYSASQNDTLTCQLGCDILIQEVMVLGGEVLANIIQTGDLSTSPTVLLENEFFQSGTTHVYFWEGPGIEPASANEFSQNIDVPGIYSLTVTDPVSGCSALDQTVVFPSAPCANMDSPIAPSDDCATAPPFCESYLNGYCSNNAFFTPDDPGVLSCQIENNQWLTFVACEEEVQIEIAVSNCLQSEGLEVSILQSSDCQLFVALNDCEIIADGSTVTVGGSNFSPGQEYLLMVDGINGDICQWAVLSTMGASDGGTFQEDNTPGQVTGPNPVCLTGPFMGTYTFTGPDCNLIPLGGCPSAGQQLCVPDPDVLPCTYDTVWYTEPPGIVQFVNGDSTGAMVDLFLSDTFDIPPGEVLTITLFVDPFYEINPNPGGEPCEQNCFTSCANIIPDDPCVVNPLEITFCQPDEQEYYFTICPGECVEVLGEIFCSPGIYTFVSEDLCGCEDIITVFIDLESLQDPPFVGGLTTFCEPDGLTYSVSFDIINPGLFDVYVNGNLFLGTTYSESGIPSGTTVDYDLFYVDLICEFNYPDAVTAFEDCPCVQQTFDEGLITLCPGDCYDLAGNIYCDPGSYEELIFNPMTGCDDLYIFEIQNINEDALATGSVSELCNALNTEYTVTFSITSGVEPYFVNGAPIAGNLYQSDPIPSGDPYAFQVNDSGQCDDDEINLEGTFTCACLTNPGTVEASLLPACEDEMVSAFWNNDATLDGDDILVFVLHTGAGSALGDILGTNITGTFGFEPGSMDYGVTYYISPVAGNDVGGTVDLGDACLGVAAGQPVIFYENPEVDILATTQITCDQNSVPLDAFPLAGSGQYEFVWSGPGLNSSGPAATATQVGTFTCTMTDLLSGCMVEASIEVTGDSELPEFDLIPSGNQLNCEIENILLETSTPDPDLVFNWSTPSGTATGTSISANEPGIYTAVATAPNGCEAEVEVNITQDISPPENLTANEGILTCDDPMAILNVTSSTPDVEFTWFFPTGNEAMGNNVTTDIDGQYTIIATGANGCTAETTTNVTDLSEPPQDLVATEGVLTCDDPTATLTAFSSTPGVVFTWVFPSGDETDADEITTDIVGGYTVIATAPNGCTEEIPSNVVDLSEPPEDITATDGELTCLQATALLEATSSTPNVTFTWVLPSGDEVDGASISAGEEGEYILIATASNGCTAEVISEVVENSEPPVLTAIGGEVNCAQPETTLSVEADMNGTTFTWTFPDGDMAEGEELNSSESGVYEIMAVAPNGCEATTTAEIIAVPDPELETELAFVLPTCAGDMDGSVIVGVTSGGLEPYTFSLDGAPISGGQFGGLSAGNYLLEIVDANGCTDEEMLEVPEPLVVAVELGDDQYANLGDQINLGFETDITPAEITWFGPNGETWEGVSSLTVPANANGIYEVEITDANGCSASDAIQIFVEGQGEVFVPNVFSPNGDEVNDILTVFSGSDVINVQSFTIFDRWGEMVFHDENFAPHTTPSPPTRGWDGTYEGKPLDPAVFVFMAQVEFATGETKMVSGDVTLLR